MKLKGLPMNQEAFETNLEAPGVIIQTLEHSPDKDFEEKHVFL